MYGDYLLQGSKNANLKDTNLEAVNHLIVNSND